MASSPQGKVTCTLIHTWYTSIIHSYLQIAGNKWHTLIWDEAEQAGYDAMILWCQQ